MRGIRFLTTIVLVSWWCGVAVAQSALKGPLAAPDSKAAAPVAPKKATHHKPGKTAHDAARKTAPSTAAEMGHPNDPVSFGMKWNGSNDDAKATRVQNYGGDAAGTGAEVGMKLLFDGFRR